VRHLFDGREVKVRAAKIKGGAPKPRTYIVGNQAANQWPDREPARLMASEED
jgi:hypothetical protein